MESNLFFLFHTKRIQIIIRFCRRKLFLSHIRDGGSVKCEKPNNCVCNHLKKSSILLCLSAVRQEQTASEQASKQTSNVVKVNFAKRNFSRKFK